MMTRRGVLGRIGAFAMGVLGGGSLFACEKPALRPGKMGDLYTVPHDPPVKLKQIYRWNGSRYKRCRMRDLLRGDLFVYKNADGTHGDTGVLRVFKEPQIAPKEMGPHWEGELFVTIQDVTPKRPADSMLEE